MKKRTMTIIISNLAILAMLTGCGKNTEQSEPIITPEPTNENVVGSAASESELLQMLHNNQEIEIEVAIPDSVEEYQGEEKQIIWEELGKATVNEDLRSDWDDELKIFETADGKNGILFVDANGNHALNNTLQVALHNRAFTKILQSEDGREALAHATVGNYVDLEAEEIDKAVYAGVNGYFNLLPDAEPNYCNADSTVNRLQFLSMVMRAETPVKDIAINDVFKAAVGSSDLLIYAQEVEKDSYLTTEDKSLNNMTANGVITRGEVIYTLVSRYYADELANVDINGATFDDCKNGGDIALQQKFKTSTEVNDYWKSYELTYSLSNPTAGCPEGLYKAMVVAKQVGILTDSETRWDEAATRSEIVEFIINAHINDDSIQSFNYEKGNIAGYEAPIEEEVETPDFEDLDDEDKANVNRNDSDSVDGLPEVEDPEDEPETPVEDEPVDEPTTPGRKNTVAEENIQWYLDFLKISREKFDSMTDKQISDAITAAINAGHTGGGDISGSGNTGGGTSGGNSGGYEETDPWGDTPGMELDPSGVPEGNM